MIRIIDKFIGDTVEMTFMVGKDEADMKDAGRLMLPIRVWTQLELALLLGAKNHAVDLKVLLPESSSLAAEYLEGQETLEALRNDRYIELEE